MAEIVNICLYYPKGYSFDLHTYSDVDYTGYKLDKKSTSDTCQILTGCLISWSSKKQGTVALSITEVEYITAESYCSQVL